MPRGGAVKLADVRGPMLTIVCERCGRHERYNVEQLIAVYGAAAMLTDLLVTLADCPRARSASIHERCQARYAHYYRR